MDVGGDASTKRPLLEEDEEADASGVSSNSHGATSTYGRAPRQVRAAQDAGRYGRLEASGEDEADDGRLDEGEVDTASQFYECEEDEALMASSPASASPSPEDGHPSSTSPTFAEPVSSPAPAASSSVSSSSSTAQAFFLRPSARNARDLPLRTAAAFSRTATARSDRDEDEPADGSVAIEMPSLIQQTPGACSSANRAAAAAAAPSSGGVLSEPVPMSTSSIAGVGTPDRHCFICLQDEEKDNPLTPCCTTCFARVHVRCWREWRNNQRITALRSRLLGLRMQTNHLLRCTICKSGTALVAGEEDGLEWMNELLCGGEAGRNEGPPAQNGPMRREDSDEDNDVQFEELVDMKTCLALVVYLAVVFWLDTEGTFTPPRVLEMLEALVAGTSHSGGAACPAVSDTDEIQARALTALSRIRRRPCGSLQELHSIVSELDVRARQGTSLPALIVIDSIAAVARNEGDTSESRRVQIPRRQAALNMLAGLFKALVAGRGEPQARSASNALFASAPPGIVVTNQVAGDPSSGNSRVALGQVWHHAVNWRLVLSHLAPGGSGGLGQKEHSFNGRRFLCIEKSPRSAPIVIEFAICRNGLVELGTIGDCSVSQAHSELSSGKQIVSLSTGQGGA